MIPILYESSERDFSHNGIGALIDAISCVVTEERNGIFELELKYPIKGRLFEFIKEDCIVKALPNETSNPQPFRIYKSSKPINGIVTFNAEHISYELSGNPIESVIIENESANTALQMILDASTLEHSYQAISDITKFNSTSLELVSARAALGGTSGSILDTYGGEYEFDIFDIKLHANRGENTGVIVAYGKNLTDIKQEKSLSEVYTAIFPYVKYKLTPEATEDTILTLPEKIIMCENANVLAYTKALQFDFSSYFAEGEEITVEELRNKAVSYIANNRIDEPKVNLAVSFIHLWQSPEYEKYAPLERVKLCDTVSVYFEEMGINATAKVIKTKFDSLKEKYESIELGNAKSNFADTFKNAINSISEVKQEAKKQSFKISAEIANAIQEATNAITGQSGGYVVLNPPENPQEILILDTPIKEDAVNVWRWNSAGFGHSKTGYNGPFETAITQDGKIVADFILAGILKGILIQGSTLESINTLGKLVISNGQIIYFKDGVGWQSLVVNSSNIHLQDEDNAITIRPSGISTNLIDTGGGELNVKDSHYDEFNAINASAFQVNSEREVKTNIIEDKESALDKLLSTKIYNYHLISELNIFEKDSEGKRVKSKKKKKASEVKKRKGMILDEAPRELIHDDTIDLYAYSALIHKAIQELNQKIDSLNGGIS